jgi:hypothetical protein
MLKNQCGCGSGRHYNECVCWPDTATHNTSEAAMKITLTNTFHNSTVNLIVGEPNRYGEYTLSESQARRAARALCGIGDCQCGGLCGWDPTWEVTDWQGDARLIPGKIAKRERLNLRCS